MSELTGRKILNSVPVVLCSMYIFVRNVMMQPREEVPGSIFRKVIANKKENRNRNNKTKGKIKCIILMKGMELGLGTVWMVAGVEKNEEEEEEEGIEAQNIICANVMHALACLLSRSPLPRSLDRRGR